MECTKHLGHFIFRLQAQTRYNTKNMQLVDGRAWVPRPRPTEYLELESPVSEDGLLYPQALGGYGLKINMGGHSETGSRPQACRFNRGADSRLRSTPFSSEARGRWLQYAHGIRLEKLVARCSQPSKEQQNGVQASWIF